MPPPISDEPGRGAAAGAAAPRAEAAGRGLRRSARHAPQALAALGLGSLAIFVVLAATSLLRAPDVGSAIGGVIGGAFTALLFAGAGCWLILAVLVPHEGAEPVEIAGSEEIEADLAPVLADLEAARLAAKRGIEARLKWLVPLGTLGGLAVWIVTQFDTVPGGVFELFLFSGIGGLMGYGWAEYKLSEDYRQLYKGSVLPRLAARFGSMTYRRAVAPHLGRLQAEGVFPAFNEVTTEDEIAGRYEGLGVSILELKLEQKEGKSRKIVFDGLLVAVELPRALSGVTAIVADEGLFGNLRARMRREKRQRVRLEDPRFESVYEVYGTDQVGARALLTPAFMERFAALGDLADFIRPLGLAVDNRLEILLSKTWPKNLFEPPGYRKPAASRSELLALHHDLEVVFGVAGAVIGLDQAARSLSAAHRREREAAPAEARAIRPPSAP